MLQRQLTVDIEIPVPIEKALRRFQVRLGCGIGATRDDRPL
jgi:hypothetical protein